MIGPDDRLFGLVRVARVHQPDRMLRQPVGLGQLVVALSWRRAFYENSICTDGSVGVLVDDMRVSRVRN